MEFRKTKIMCTLGNKTCTVPSIIKLLEAGMNVARIAMPQLRAEIENRQQARYLWDWDQVNDEILSADSCENFGGKLSLTSMINKVKQASKKCGKECSIYVDLQGPTIRTKDFKDG